MLFYVIVLIFAFRLFAFTKNLSFQNLRNLIPPAQTRRLIFSINFFKRFSSTETWKNYLRIAARPPTREILVNLTVTLTAACLLDLRKIKIKLN
jgi:ABC-type sugar transport system permease subunit